MRAKRFDIVDEGGALRLTLDGRANSPGDREVEAILLAAANTGELVVVGGMAVRVVGLKASASSDVVTVTVSTEGKAP